MYARLFTYSDNSFPEGTVVICGEYSDPEKKGSLPRIFEANEATRDLVLDFKIFKPLSRLCPTFGT